MDKIGLDTVSSFNGKPHHGIYFQGNNFLISGNRIQNIYNTNGNCISVRSNGIVRNNILSDATKNGISYFSDHPAVERTLLIENNIVYNCERGVSIADGGKLYVDSTIIRFNTLITQDKMCISIGVGLNMSINIDGNVLIRKDGSPIYIWDESPYKSEKNVLSSGNIGFVNFNNHDYHITHQSIAYSYATGLSIYPVFDFENNLRTSSRLDAGADQIETNTQVSSTTNDIIAVFPNPSKDKIHLIISDLFYVVQLVNIYGQVVFSGNNIKTIDTTLFPCGTYILLVTSNTFIRKHKIIVS